MYKDIIMDNIKATGSTDVEQWTIGNVYLNREAIVAHPEQYRREITSFSAGGGPACAFKREVDISQLAQCWLHPEYHYKCPKCGHDAHIYHFAGHITGGGYWCIHVYCPECDCGYSIHYPQGLSHWTVLRDIYKETEQNSTTENS